MFAYFLLSLTVCFGNNNNVRIEQRRSLAIADNKQGNYVAACMHYALLNHYKEKGSVVTLTNVKAIVNPTVIPNNDFLHNFTKNEFRDELELDSDL